MHLTDIKNLKRFKNIVTILAKYGFDEIVDRLEVPGADFLHSIGPVDSSLKLFERIRIVIEELGPTFVKFGQIMSLRPDLLPEELLVELEKLQDSVPAVDSAEIVPEIEKSLGQPIAEVFSEFDFEPVAAASLSQVHRGILKENGAIVAVKAQRPGIVKDITSDLDILDTICRFLDQQFEELRCYNLPELAGTVRQTLMQELNFKNELNNINIARSYAAPDIFIPIPYGKYSSKKLLVMEFFDGVNLKDLLPTKGDEREQIARLGLQTVVQQILEDGFFHADPHPGNLLVDSEMRLCLIDWGLVGRLTEQDRFMLIEILSAVVDRDSHALVDGFLQLCRARGKKTNRKSLERGLLNILDSYYALPIKDVDIGGLLRGLLALLREHNLQLPIDMVIMIKALVTAEGSARLVFPELSVIDELKGSVHRLAKERYKPGVLWRGMRRSFAGFFAMQRELPRHLLQIIDKIEDGELSFKFHLEKLEYLVNTLESASNRLTTGIITGSIIMGSSMIVTTGVGPFLFGLPALGVIGYLLSVVLGLWLVITILRTKKY
ncbi:ABC1 kinase family protein [Desulfocastanea catecholica]